MKINIYFDIAAVILAVLMIVSLFVRGLYKGRTNKMFIILCVLTCIEGLLDCVSNLYGKILPENEFTIPDQSMLNYAYFFLRNATTPYYIFYIYSVLGVWHEFKTKKWLLPCLLIPYSIDVLLLISNRWTNFVFTYTQSGHYMRGRLIFVLYAVAFYYMILALVIVISKRKIMMKSKMIILVSYVPISAIAVLAQFLFSSLRVEIISTAVMAIVVAIGVQRPEENYDLVVNSQSFSSFINDADTIFMTKRPISTIFVKIANHKMLRNNIGLESYSMLLRSVSDRIQKVCRIMSLYADVYYMDRGAFAVIVDYEKRDMLQDCGRLLSAYFQDVIDLGGIEITMDARIVMALVPYDLDTKEQFIGFASNFSHLFPAENSLLLLEDYADDKTYKIQNEIDQIINRALQEKYLQMYYQPIYSIKEKKFTSCEALIRLIDPEFGIVSPGVFIPASEKSGAIHQIGDFVIDEVCNFIDKNNMKDMGVHYVEINLSVAQCVEPNLCDKFNRILGKYNLSHDSINVEITETAVDSDHDITIENIEKMSEQGYSFSLDDYGTGYSNVQRLATLPLDIVKLDKSFVDEMDDPNMYKVIVNTVNMLKKLNKKILVEGVETRENFEIFERLGCDYIQGFYFSRPLPAKDYIKFVKEKNF